MAAVEIHTRWFKIVLKVDAPALALQVVVLLRQWAVQYYFGSLNLKLSPAQVTELKAKFADTIDLREDTNIRSNAWVVSDSEWDLEDDLYVFSMRPQNAAASELTTKFYADFLRLFKTDARGALVIKKTMYQDIKLFAITFADTIKDICGLQCWVPRLSTKDTTKNKMEMFRLFVSAYPAYHNLCVNRQWENKFYWSYAINEEEESAQEKASALKS